MRLLLIVVTLAFAPFAQPVNAGICSKLLSLAGFNRRPTVIEGLDVPGISWKNTAFGWVGEGQSEWGRTQIVSNENYVSISIIPFAGTLRFHDGVLNELLKKIPTVKYRIIEPLSEETLQTGEYALDVKKKDAPLTFGEDSKTLLRTFLIELPIRIRSTL